MHRRALSQDQIVAALKGKIEQALSRPVMYCGHDLQYLRGFLGAYVDALALSCSGYTGGFLYGDLPQVDPIRTADENVLALTSAVRAILADVPSSPSPPENDE